MLVNSEISKLGDRKPFQGVYNGIANVINQKNVLALVPEVCFPTPAVWMGLVTLFGQCGRSELLPRAGEERWGASSPALLGLVTPPQTPAPWALRKLFPP